MRLLHGDYDGGGLTALAMSGDRVASAGRDGNCQYWRFSGDELLPLAELSTGASIVSAIVLGEESEVVWCASLDGRVRRFEEDPAGGCWACSLEMKAAAACLSLAVCEAAGVLAVGTADGDVELFATADGAARGSWRPLGGGAGSRAVAIARVGSERCVVVGGSDGALRLRFLVKDGDSSTSSDPALQQGEDEQDWRFAESSPGEPMLPPHGGPCVALTPLDEVRGGGLLVSGAHDGTLRVWDLADGRVEGIPSAAGPKCLYGLGGYKVWLGSVCVCDSTRLVSDGRDNVIVVHDFSEPQPGKGEDNKDA